MDAQTLALDPIDTRSIPSELKNRNNWTCFRLVPNGGKKPKKIPYNPANDRPASISDPATWASFDTATTALNRYDGLNFNLDGSDLIGLDIDNCRDPQTGTLTVEAPAIVARIPSYWEISPSGRGLRSFAKGNLPGGHRNKVSLGKGQAFEIYSSKHSLSVTGNHVHGTPLEVTDCSQEVNTLDR
jgi:putative DNA primase/helicase